MEKLKKERRKFIKILVSAELAEEYEMLIETLKNQIKVNLEDEIMKINQKLNLVCMYMMIPKRKSKKLK